MTLPDVPTNGKFRVLVVEDDSHIARLILANLTKAGLECRYAPDGVAGFKAFEEANPHLVLTDIMMPGMDGRQLCTKIRESSTIPIIMMTAADSEEAEMAGFKVGADDYVPKPFNPKLLIARVIANLRRVYRYDFKEEEEKKSPPAEGSLPAGWASCDMCGYMGPREKFEKMNSRGDRFATCPRCQQGESITFSIG